MRSAILALAALLTVAGCATRPNYEPATVTAAQTTAALPAPSLADTTVVRTAYRLGPLDKIEVKVFGSSDLDRTGQLDGDGNFNMPLIGTVAANGLSADEFARKLERLYGTKYLTNPQVAVAIVESGSRMVTIDGGVTRPGKLPLVGDTSLIETVAAAGGLTDKARADEVLIFRNISGKRMVARYDLRAIRGGRSPDPQVYGNDVIVVGEDANRGRFAQFLQATPIIGVFANAFIN